MTSHAGEGCITSCGSSRAAKRPAAAVHHTDQMALSVQGKANLTVQEQGELIQLSDTHMYSLLMKKDEKKWQESGGALASPLLLMCCRRLEVSPSCRQQLCCLYPADCCHVLREHESTCCQQLEYADGRKLLVTDAEPSLLVVRVCHEPVGSDGSQQSVPPQ